MTDIVKPPFVLYDEEDPFLIPPGQPGSYVDALAAAEHMVRTTRSDASSVIVMLVVLELS